MSATTTTQDPAAQLSGYLQLIAGRRPSGRVVEIRYTAAHGGMNRLFVPVRRLDTAARTIRSLVDRADVYCGALLRTRHSGGRDAVAAARLAWVEIDQPDAIDRLERFAHPPSMIVTSGTPGHAHAYWQLRHAVDAETIERANRRLAHALDGDLASVDAARILRPGGTLNHKHQPPTPVVVVADDPGRRYRLAELVDDLQDPPVSRSRGDRGGVGRGHVTQLDEPLLAIPARTYVHQLAGLEPARDGKVACPFHDDATPSLQLYDDGTFYCFGCQAGGSVYDFAARLWHTGTKGREFLALRDRLRAELTP
jgi:hypothetical protein